MGERKESGTKSVRPEIVITPEMIEEGMKMLSEYEHMFSSPELFLDEMYRRMSDARNINGRAKDEFRAE